MTRGNWLSVVRDCEALLIPTAVPITIPAGTQVQVVQQLGDTATIQVSGNLARVESKELDALGLEVKTVEPVTVNKVADGPVEPEAVWAALKTCFDPEIPVNIVDLGLVYEMDVTTINEGLGNRVNIKMTLTAAGCGMGPVIAEDVKKKVIHVENVTEVLVDLVFDPPWTQDRMTEAAQLQLGLL